jgi:hypothetical protein
MTSAVRRSILEVLFPVASGIEEGVVEDEKAKEEEDASPAAWTPPPSAPPPPDEEEADDDEPNNGPQPTPPIQHLLGGALLLDRMEEGERTNGDARHNKYDDFSIDMNNNNNNNEKMNNKLCSICLERLGTYLCLALPFVYYSTHSYICANLFRIV